MGRETEIKRETVVDDRTSGTTGTATVATVTEIGGLELQHFDEIMAHIKTSVSLAGTTPTMDIYFQIAVVPSPDATVDAHWDDYARFTQVTASADEILVLGSGPPTGAANPGSTGDVSHTRGVSQGGFTQGVAFAFHFGDRIRIREVMGGTVTTAAVYDIHFTGRMN